MEEYRLIADSSCDLYKGHPLANFSVDFVAVPLTLIIGDKEFVDTPETDCREMFNEMNSYKGSSSSACPSIDAFYNEFKGAKRSIAIAMTSGLSGTYNSALMAKKMILEEEPTKEIIVIDSLATSAAMVLLLRYADKMIVDGVPFDEMEAKLLAYRDTIKFICIFSSFGNLIKTGRMPKIAGKFASILNMRAIATTTSEGKLVSVDKGRGEKAGMEKAKKLFPAEMKNKPVVIHHCYNKSGAATFAEMLKKEYGITDITIIETRCLCTFYTDNQGLMVAL